MSSFDFLHSTQHEPLTSTQNQPPTVLNSIEMEQHTPTRNNTNLDNVLSFLTPSSSLTVTENEIDENTCQMCNAKHNTDNDLDSPWIGCSARDCKYWVHVICIGLILQLSLYSSAFFVKVCNSG